MPVVVHIESKYVHDTPAVYTPVQTKIKKVYCGFCNTLMQVEQKHKVSQYRGYQEYDLYTCPYIKEQWHVQAGELLTQIKSSASRTIRTMLQTELHQILTTRTPTLSASEIKEARGTKIY